MVNDRFGEELSLDEILTDEEKAEDKFLRSRPGENFGPELTLREALDILFETNLPPRATFWEKHEREVEQAILAHATQLDIDDYHFKIEYMVRISSVRRFDTGTPMMYRSFSPNGKVTNDSEGRNSSTSSTGSGSNTDV